MTLDPGLAAFRRIADQVLGELVRLAPPTDDEIRGLLDAGLRVHVVARQLGVSHSRVYGLQRERQQP